MNAPAKSAQKSPRGRPFTKGGDKRQGRGPKKDAPNAGRTPDEFKAKMRELCSTDDKLEHLEKILKNPKHPQYMAAFKLASAYGFGMPAQPITGADGAPLIPVGAITVTLVAPTVAE